MNNTEHDEDFAECFPNNGSQISLGEPIPDSASEPPAEVQGSKGNEVAKPTRARTNIRDARRIEPSVGGGGGFGVARRREKTGVGLSAAVENSRASERRCW